MFSMSGARPGKSTCECFGKAWRENLRNPTPDTLLFLSTYLQLRKRDTLCRSLDECTEPSLRPCGKNDFPVGIVNPLDHMPLSKSIMVLFVSHNDLIFVRHMFSQLNYSLFDIKRR